MVMNRRSPTEWSGSGTVIESGSKKAVAASSNETRCLRTFSAAFSLSHTKRIGEFYAPPCATSNDRIERPHIGRLAARDAVHDGSRTARMRG